MAVIKWLNIDVQCSACNKKCTVVLGTKTKEDKPISKCPLCKSDQIQIFSVTPRESEK